MKQKEETIGTEFPAEGEPRGDAEVYQSSSSCAGIGWLYWSAPAEELIRLALPVIRINVATELLKRPNSSVQPGRTSKIVTSRGVVT